MTDSTSPLAAGTNRSLRRSRPRYGEAAIKVSLLVAALVSVATTVGIVISLIPPTMRFFERIGVWDFLTGRDWSPLFEPPSYGVLPLIAGTLVTTAIAIAVAVPLGLAAAIYLSEYARPRIRATFKPVLEVLAGIPTVVYGFFALSFVTPLLRDYWPGGSGPETFNALSAGPKSRRSCNT